MKDTEKKPIDHLLKLAADMHKVLTYNYLDRVTDKQLLVDLIAISDGLTVREYNLVNQTLFRARIGSFDDLPDVLYPPCHLVTRHGRLNGIGETTFYCSNRKDTAVLELRPSVGDLITILELSFDSIDVFGVGMDMSALIGSHPEDFRHAIQGRIDFLSQPPTLFGLLRTDMVNAFFHRLITSPGSSIGHRITGVFSKHLFKNCTGLMFPCSVSTDLAMRFGAGNFALKPEFVDKNAKFKTMTVCEVIERNANFSILRPRKTLKLN